MTVRLAVTVQHHPSRQDLLPNLRERLGDLSVQVVMDPEPNGQPSPWRTYQHSLRHLPDWATHLLVIQDDAQPCDGFDQAVCNALTARPELPIALFVAGAPADSCLAVKQAAARGERWVQLSPWSWFPAVASVWPAAMATRMLEWATDKNIQPHLTRADDAVLAKFLQHEGVWPLACVPSLVEHPDVVPSAIGRKHWAGQDRTRVACVGASGDMSQTVW